MDKVIHNSSWRICHLEDFHEDWVLAATLQLDGSVLRQEGKSLLRLSQEQTLFSSPLDSAVEPEPESPRLWLKKPSVLAHLWSQW